MFYYILQLIIIEFFAITAEPMNPNDKIEWIIDHNYENKLCKRLECIQKKLNRDETTREEIQWMLTKEAFLKEESRNERHLIERVRIALLKAIYALEDQEERNRRRLPAITSQRNQQNRTQPRTQ